MNENSSLERRYSFNLAQSTPIADSTHINGNSFPWGSVSPKRQGSSNLNRSTTSSFYYDEPIDNSRILHPKRIDARIAADVQSKGLASRIVKYHDSETRLNRSMSAHNLFSKPGLFPAVTLKKTNLPYRAARRELSMIRIPPPSKSSFYGNTVSGLMRSNSVIGLQSKQNEDLSTENRPIIHPPPTENDMAPTRSVLDVLKEISRKRINSDELESEENSKKYCSRAGIDFVDTAINQQNFSSSSLSPCQRYKRQRDCVTHHQGIQHLETKTSPEQAKKRVCNYNNDITSSLSSSIKCKKITAQSLDQTLSSNSSHQNINVRNIDMRLRGLENNYKMSNESFNLNDNSEALRSPNKSEAVAQRSVSEPHIKLDRKIENCITHTAQKPRLTLFNKKWDERESSELGAKSDTEEQKLGLNENDCTGIIFVKPKKTVSKNVFKNPVMERTQKSKLALMLSGLKGELYQNSDLDEIDSSNKIKQTNSNDNTNIVTVSPDSKKNIPTLATVTSTVTSTSNIETPTLTNSTVSLPTNKTSPLVGLKLLPAKEIEVKDSCTHTLKNTEESSKPLSNGFSFNVSSSSSTSAVQSSCTSLNASESKTSQTSFAPMLTLGDKMNESSAKIQLPVNENNTDLSKFPDNFKAPTSSTGNAKATDSLNISSMSSTTNVNKSSTEHSAVLTTTSINVVVSSAPDSFTKPNTSIAPSIPSPIYTVSVAPPTNSDILITGALNNNKAVTTTTSSTPTIYSSSSFSSAFPSKPNISANNTVLSTGNISLSTPVFSFNTNRPSTIETEKTNESAASKLSFNNGKSENVSSFGVFGSNKDTITKAQETGSGFSFSSDAKSNGNCSDQSIQQPENFFNSGTLAKFDSIKVPANSMMSIFGNVGKSSENNIFKTTGTSSIFSSNSTKPAAEVFGSNSNKSEILNSKAALSSNENNNAITMPFSFGTNPATFAVTNQNKTSAGAGGFSFGSAALNCGDSRPNEHATPSNSSFGGTATSVSQNSFVFGSSSSKVNPSTIFGVSSQKNENTVQGGFSFGSATPIKTFNFGAEKASGTEMGGMKTPSASFTFGAPVDTKQNILSTNKPFSFGSIQPMQQKQTAESSSDNAFTIFGSAGTTKPSQLPPFNFSSGNSQTNALPSDIFASQTTSMTTGPGDRRIRRATRRLQK